jgi:hypothetical protein
VESQKLQYFYEGYYGRCDDYYWVSYYDFFDRIGIFKSKKFDKFREFRELIKCNLFTNIIQDKICLICRPPIELHRDRFGRMHNTKNYAIKFKDSFGLHYIHGVFFNYEDFEKFILNKPSAKDIIKIKNLEQKSALIQLYGYDNIINELKTKTLDRWVQVSQITNRKAVCELLEVDIEGFKGKLLKLEDHSVHKITFLGVPRDIKTVKEAIKWTFQLAPNESYDPVMES